MSSACESSRVRIRVRIRVRVRVRVRIQIACKNRLGMVPVRKDYGYRFRNIHRTRAYCTHVV